MSAHCLLESGVL